jgi:hypothetical protein
MGTQASLDPPSIAISVGLVLISVVASFAIVAGALFALVNPARGIQDFLVGTVLVRK